MMRARMVAVFAIGFACGALFIGVILWQSGALVTAAGARKTAAENAAETATPTTAPSPQANLPEPSTGNPGDVLSNLGKHPPVPPPVASAEPSDFSAPAAAATPTPTPAAPSSGSRPVIGPPAPSERATAEHPAEKGDADRIATERMGLPSLKKPIDNVDLSKLAGEFDQPRDGHKHQAIDIMAPRGTPVHAVAQGNVAKLFTSKLGGLTVYQFDDSRTWCFYYAHLDRYAKGLKEGTLLRPGDVIGYVGSTGDASPSSPHLHFAVFKLGPEKKWWEGTAIDPLPLFQ